MSAEWVRSSLETADRQRVTTTPCRGSSSQSNDRPLLSPARFIPASSEPSNSIRPPSKWSPVSSDCNTNDLSFRSSKTGVSILCFSWIKNEMCYCVVVWYMCIRTRAGQWCKFLITNNVSSKKNINHIFNLKIQLHCTDPWTSVEIAKVHTSEILNLKCTKKNQI